MRGRRRTDANNSCSDRRGTSRCAGAGSACSDRCGDSDYRGRARKELCPTATRISYHGVGVASVFDCLYQRRAFHGETGRD